ncbi:MAG: hypothetical protein M3O30_13290 [Planctomycetota bacterium]|nr:hypothetical protein [Planctomycetota bacterium]
MPTLDGRHITQAINLIRIYVSLVPTDLDAQHLLLELQTPLPSYAGSSIALASDMLRSNPQDLVALKTIIEVNLRSRKFEDAWPAAQKYTEINPTDLEVQEESISVMHQMGKSPAELRQRADDLAAKYPNDPRFLLIQASAYSVQGPADTLDARQKVFETARNLVIKASQQDPPDAQFVNFTIAQLDRIGEYSLSQNLLDRAVAKLNDPELTRILVQRLWENHKFAEVISRLEKLDPTSPAADVQLVAYKALSLFALNRKAEANALVSNLSARSNDRIAYAWSLALKTHFDETNADVKSELTSYREALQRSPDNAIIQTMLGDAYAKIGENELALQSWRQAAGEVPSWSEPHIRIAEVLASQGQGSDQEALTAAQQALMTTAQGPHTYDPQGAIARILVDYARWQATQDSEISHTLLENLLAVQNKMPGEPNTLPIYASVLAQTGQRDKAIEVIRGGEKQSGPDGESVLLKLAQVSRITKLGMEPEIYNAVEQQYGLTARVSYARATSALAGGQAAAGLKILQDAKTHGAGTPQLWDRVICQYRELSRDPDAGASWAALGDANPGDLSIQSLILTGEESAWSNRAFIDRTINRVKDLTSDEAISWKLARARWLLSSADVQRDASAAVVLLNEVIKSSSADYKPRVLLATAYDRLNDPEDAAAQWEQAAVLQPNSSQILLSLMRELHAAAKYNETRTTFDKLSGFSSLPPDVALQAAAIMAQEGELQRAQTMLEANPNPRNPVLHDATLAKVYRLEGRISDTAQLYFNLAKASSLDIMTIREAADFFGSQHDIQAAHRMLNHADATSLPTDEHDLLLADFDDNWGDRADAVREYADAVAHADENPAASVAQAGFFIRHQQWADAQRILDVAGARWPDNKDLKVLQSMQRNLANVPQSAQMAFLLRAVSRDPQNPAGQETLRVVSASGSDNVEQTITSLRSLLEKYPDFLPLYEVTLPQLLRAGRTDEAISLGAKIMAQFSSSADAARIATQAYMFAGRWNDVILAAGQWRMRDAAHPQEADRMIAMADLHTNQARDAVDRLAPYVSVAQSNPDANENILLEYAEALIRSGNESDASALLLPLARNSAQWRANWLQIAVFSHTDGPSTAAWIEQIRPLLDPHSLTEQQHLADAYFDCATRRGYPKGFEFARDALKPFVGTAAITVPALMSFASAADNAGDLPTAEIAYRRVLQMDSTQTIAQNNLAEVLRAKGSSASIKEAEALARAAIAVRPNDPASSTYYDTLAHILLQEQRTEDAFSTFEAGYRLQPKDLNVLIGLTWLSAKNNRINAANHYLEQVQALLPSDSQVDGEVKQELDTARDLLKKANTSNSITGTGPADR